MRTFILSSVFWGPAGIDCGDDWEVSIRKGCKYALLNFEEVGDYSVFARKRILLKTIGQHRCGSTILDVSGKLWYGDGDKLIALNITIPLRKS